MDLRTIVDFVVSKTAVYLPKIIVAVIVLLFGLLIIKLIVNVIGRQLDSKKVDAQAGLETGITLSLGIASGADIFGHMGICGMDQGTSLDILIMQSEIISYLESANRIISFDDDLFATNLINEVGPKGTFLNKRHTAKSFRKEIWFPKLLDRQNYNNWLNDGSTDMEKRCRECKEEILANYEPKPLEEDIIKDLEKILEDAKRNFS